MSGKRSIESIIITDTEEEEEDGDDEDGGGRDNDTDTEGTATARASPIRKKNASTTVDKHKKAKQINQATGPTTAEQLAERKRRLDRDTSKHAKQEQQPYSSPPQQSPKRGVKPVAPSSPSSSPRAKKKQKTSGGGYASSGRRLVDTDPGAPTPGTAEDAQIKFADGALRIWRTPGRVSKRMAKNVVHLGEVFVSKEIEQMWACASVFAEDEMKRFLPIGSDSVSKEDRPCFITRDLALDPEKLSAAKKAGLDMPWDDAQKLSKKKLNQKEIAQVVPILKKHYERELGKNYHAVYTKDSHQVHAKMAFIEYDSFYRVVITSADWTLGDTWKCSNHVYIQDFPHAHSEPPKVTKQHPFLRDLIAFATLLHCPQEILDNLTRCDFSKVKLGIRLWTSRPGTFARKEMHDFGIGRLGFLSRKLLNVDDGSADAEGCRLEVCSATLGTLDAPWLRQTMQILLEGTEDLPASAGVVKRGPRKSKGKSKAKASTSSSSKGKGKGKQLVLSDDDDADEDVDEDQEEEDQLASDQESDHSDTEAKKKKKEKSEKRDRKAEDKKLEDLPLQIIYPHRNQVGSLDDDVLRNAVNMSANAMMWTQRGRDFKRLFRNYIDHDGERLTHQKTIMLRSPGDPRVVPKWISIGSATFSPAAIGNINFDKDGKPKIALASYECNMFIPGNHIASLLEDGSHWTDILTYERPPDAWAKDDDPWSYSNWVKSKAAR